MNLRYLLSPKYWQEFGGQRTREARGRNTKGPALKQCTVFLDEPEGSKQGSDLI